MPDRIKDFIETNNYVGEDGEEFVEIAPPEEDETETPEEVE